jgi:hypothetical protein
LAALNEKLGDDAVAHAWEEGRALGDDDVVGVLENGSFAE